MAIVRANAPPDVAVRRGCVSWCAERRRGPSDRTPLRRVSTDAAADPTGTVSPAWRRPGPCVTPRTWDRPGRECTCGTTRGVSGRSWRQGGTDGVLSLEPTKIATKTCGVVQIARRRIDPGRDLPAVGIHKADGYNQLTERALNDLEAEGWEVVGITSRAETIRIAGASAPGDPVVFRVFKRPKAGATILHPRLRSVRDAGRAVPSV